MKRSKKYRKKILGEANEPYIQIKKVLKGNRASPIDLLTGLNFRINEGIVKLSAESKLSDYETEIQTSSAGNPFVVVNGVEFMPWAESTIKGDKLNVSLKVQHDQGWTDIIEKTFKTKDSIRSIYSALSRDFMSFIKDQV